MTKDKKTKKFFKGKRLEIGRILVEEMTEWKSTKAISEEEFYKLVDRLFGVK